MITKKREAMELLAQYEKILSPLYNKPCTMRFDMHTFNDVIITGMELGKIGDLDIDIGKHLDPISGKKRSPMIFNICTDSGMIVLPFDSIKMITLGLHKVRVVITLDKPLYDQTTMILEFIAES